MRPPTLTRSVTRGCPSGTASAATSAEFKHNGHLEGATVDEKCVHFRLTPPAKMNPVAPSRSSIDGAFASSSASLRTRRCSSHQGNVGRAGGPRTEAQARYGSRHWARVIRSYPTLDGNVAAITSNAAAVMEISDHGLECRFRSGEKRITRPAAATMVAPFSRQGVASARFRPRLLDQYWICQSNLLLSRSRCGRHRES